MVLKNSRFLSPVVTLLSSLLFYFFAQILPVLKRKIFLVFVSEGERIAQMGLVEFVILTGKS